MAPSANDLVWRIQRAMTPERRAMVRRWTDPIVGPLGSLKGVRTPDTIGLTFDDGPGPATGPVLDVLRHHGATATFFVLVERAEQSPGTIDRIRREGHEVALHGIDHTRLTSLSRSEAGQRISQGMERLAELTGGPVRRFRPPFGSQSLGTFVEARRAGLDVVVWSADARDWEDRNPAEIAASASDAVVGGDVLLLHDAFEADLEDPLPEPRFDRAEALHLLLSSLQDRGVRAASIDRLVTLGKPVRTAWFRP